jgi:hypothetical protein
MVLVKNKHNSSSNRQARQGSVLTRTHLRPKAMESKEPSKQFILGTPDGNPAFVVSVTWKKLKSIAGTSKD